MEAPAEDQLANGATEARSITSSTDQKQDHAELAVHKSRRPTLLSKRSTGSGSGQSRRGHDSSSYTNAPPFWRRHGRSVSQVSYQSLLQVKTSQIQLEDHSEETDVQTQGCWARSVVINDHVIVSGPSGIGAYIVWNCTVDTLKGGSMNIRKRYSEFDQLRANLVKSFPHAEASIPALPRKSVVSRFRPKFLEQRKNGLNHFMNCVLLNPEFAASPVLKDFIFS